MKNQAIKKMKRKFAAEHRSLLKKKAKEVCNKAGLAGWRAAAYSDMLPQDSGVDLQSEYGRAWYKGWLLGAKVY